MNSKYPRLLAVLALSLLVASSLFAQTSTTGALEGTVSDANGPLPGVTVELHSPNLQGARVAVTDADGSFRFALLPPGSYTLTANLSGFAEVNRGNIQVPLGKTATVEVRMSSASVTQEI